MLKLLMTATAVAGLVSTPAYAGNGAPSGPHYNLNIIGMSKDKDITNDSGHVIFVDLSGRTRINLTMGDFDVTDKDGTDGEAGFQLPTPDADYDGDTAYSVFVRGLGKPGGSAVMQTCVDEFTGDPADLTDNVTDYCSSDGDIDADILIEAHGNNNKFTNVSKYLLYVSIDIDGDGNVERIPLFDDSLVGIYWDYNNNGLRLAQLRFYECSTAAWDDADVVRGNGGPDPAIDEGEPAPCVER